MGPKVQGESASDKAARLRERRISSIEGSKAASETAAGLTNDLRSAYTRPSLFAMSK